MSNNKQSSVEWYAKESHKIIAEAVRGYIKGHEWHLLELKALEKAKAMQQEQAQQYAEFCIRCDRESLPILDFNSWIAHNETFGGNNEQQ